jgi:hypothetical protein
MADDDPISAADLARIKAAKDEFFKTVGDTTALSKNGKLTNEESARRIAAAQLKMMHAVNLIDPEGAGLPPRLEASLDGRSVYWHFDESGAMQDTLPSPAIEPWDEWQTAVSETRDVFWKLCEKFGEASAHRIFREATGLTDSEHDNCALLEEFIFYKLPVGEFARRKGGEQRAKAIEKQLRRLLSPGSRKNAPPYLDALIAEACEVAITRLGKPGRPKK